MPARASGESEEAVRVRAGWVGDRAVVLPGQQRGRPSPRSRDDGTRPALCPPLPGCDRGVSRARACRLAVGRRRTPSAQADHRPRGGRRRPSPRRPALSAHRGAGGRQRRGGPCAALALRPYRGEPDLRPAHRRVLPRPAPVRRLFHPDPDRCPGQPPEQRRDRGPEGLHVDAVRGGVQRRLAAARRRGDALPLLADHGRSLAADAGVPAARPPGGATASAADPRVDAAQRRAGLPDDRAVQRRRGPARHAVRAPGHGGRPVRGAGRESPGRRRPHRDEQPGLRRRPHPRRLPRDRLGLRDRRVARDRREPVGRDPPRPLRAARTPLRAADRPVERPDRRHDRPGEFRAGLRGPRPGTPDRRARPGPARCPPARSASNSTPSGSVTPPPTR